MGPISLSVRRFRAFSIFLSALFPCAAQAEIYRCINAEGKTITSDRPIPECANKSVKVYKNNGKLKQEIAAPLTAEEKQKQIAELNRKKAEELAEEVRQKEERFLLAHYKSEADIELARKRSIDAVEEKKRLANEQLASLNQSIEDLQKELKSQKKVAGAYDSLKTRADELANIIKNNRKSIAAYDEEIVRINREFDETLGRFRVIIKDRKCTACANTKSN
jgi:wobble nucleotide-excising tRNase